MTNDEAQITGGTFNGLTVVGQHNRITVHDAECDELKATLDRLIAELKPQAAMSPAAAVAHERTEQLAEELAARPPEPSRVRRSWERLSSALDKVKVGVEVAELAKMVAALF